MRLNHDYVRDILLYIEKNLGYDEFYNTHKEIHHGKLLCDEHFANYDKQELTYALELLIKSGFIELAARPNIHDGNINSARIIGLTWNGHELLDNIRDDTIWNAVKEKSKKIGKVSITALASAAGGLANAMMTDPNALNNFLQGIDNIGKMF